ncbi:fatty-acid amide hydrolase 2-B [Xylocopa sonorina]|uniref:fatty-acid amide hydrolase 2-B n=1 Tax=Xylocopa sonorina TaxID=1818115 RepID=UPI00403A97B8
MHPFLWLMNCRKPSKVSAITNPILKLSATTLARKIRNGELSSEMVVQAYIERIKEVNSLLNAVVNERFEDALYEAKMYDAQLKDGKVTASYLETEKPLYGVPVTIKEICGVKGLSHTAGTVCRAGQKALDDGAAVKLLKDAGAIPLLVSNIPHLCAGYNTTNHLYGTTYNPYNTRKSPGGSSGGEAALISSGASVLGLGTDLAGSIRIPAHMTGIFGFKPSSGIIPLEGQWPEVEEETFNGMLALGPLARHMEDIYMAMKVLSAKSAIPLHLDEPVDIKNLKIFYANDIRCNTPFAVTTPPDIRNAIDKASTSTNQYWLSAKEELRKKINDLLQDNGVLIIPTYPSLLMYPKQLNFMMEYNRFSIIGNLCCIPSIHVPMGLNKDGIPIGFQVLSATLQDRLCLAVAKELESAFGGWVPPS